MDTQGIERVFEKIRDGVFADLSLEEIFTSINLPKTPPEDYQEEETDGEQAALSSDDEITLPTIPPRTRPDDMGKLISVDFWAHITGNGQGDGTYQSWNSATENSGTLTDEDAAYRMTGDASNILCDINAAKTLPNPDKSWPGASRGDAYVRVFAVEIDSSTGTTRYYFSWNGLGTCGSYATIGTLSGSVADTNTWDQASQPASKDGLLSYEYRPYVSESSNGDGTAVYTVGVIRRPVYDDSEGALKYKDQEEVVTSITFTATEGS